MRRTGLRRRSPCALLAAAIAAVQVGPAPAQEAGAERTAPDRLLSDAARISLVTIMPGEKVYSLFGHNALRVFDPERGIDIAYNYGTFDFGNPLVFSAKFAHGDLNYRLARQSFERMAAFYPAEEGRPIVEQVLDLDPAQRERVFRFLEWNAAPENAYYRYDFYYDNCATRIRDVLEDVLGDSLIVGLPDPDVSMRQLLDPYLVGNPWLHFGMDVGQGRPADAPATWRSELFLPDRLARWATEARIRGPSGDRPLVARTDSIGWSMAGPAPRPSPPWPLLLMAALLVLVVLASIRNLRAGVPSQPWLDVPLFAALGVAGLLIVFLAFISLHAVTRNNVNLLWALPTGLALAWELRGSKRSAWGRWLLWITAGAAGAFVLGWPWWTQEVPAATLPLAIAVAVRSVVLAASGRRSQAAA